MKGAQNANVAKRLFVKLGRVGYPAWSGPHKERADRIQSRHDHSSVSFTAVPLKGKFRGRETRSVAST